MNFLKKMENLLEQVDSQAAKTIQSPKTVLPTMLSTGAIGSRRKEAGMFDASTQELIDEDFDLDLSLTDVQPEKVRPLPRAVSTPAVRQAPRIRAQEVQRQREVTSRLKVEQKQVEEEFFADVGEESSTAKALNPAAKSSTSSWDDWDADMAGASALTVEDDEASGEFVTMGTERGHTGQGEMEKESGFNGSRNVAAAPEPSSGHGEKVSDDHDSGDEEHSLKQEVEAAADKQDLFLEESLDAIAGSAFETAKEDSSEGDEEITEAEASQLLGLSGSLEEKPFVRETSAGGQSPMQPSDHGEKRPENMEKRSETDPSVRRLEAQLNDTRAELEDTKAELQELSEEKANFLVEYRLSKSRFATLQQKAKELSERYGKLQQALKSSQVQMKRFQEEKTLLSSKVETLEGQREELDAELRNRDAQQLQLQRSLDERESALRAVQAEKKELSVQLEHYGSVQREIESGKNRDLEEEASKREQLEEELEQRRLDQEREREEASTRRQALEEEVAQLSGTVHSTLEELLRLKEQRVRDEAEIKRYIKDTSSLRQELTGYKKRAAQVLQEKDTQILNLSQPFIDPASTSEGDAGVNSSSSSTRNERELEELMEEKENLQEQLKVSEQRLSALSESLMEAERQAMEEQELLQVAVVEAEAALEQERARMKQVQLDKLSLSKELASAREKLDQQQVAAKKDLEAKEAAFDKLKRKMALQANSSSSESELEERLQQMTETIIRKQTTIDTLTSENAALQMHLESKLQTGDGTAGGKLSYQRGGEVNYERRAPEDLDDEEMGRERDAERVTPMMTLVPNLATSNSFYAEQVKKAAAYIDHLTAQVNQVLRQHPSARLSLALYLLALHAYLLFSFFVAGEVVLTEVSE